MSHSLITGYTSDLSLNVIWEACFFFLLSAVTGRWKYVTLTCCLCVGRHRTVKGKKEEDLSSSTLNSKDLKIYGVNKLRVFSAQQLLTALP